MLVRRNIKRAGKRQLEYKNCSSHDDVENFTTKLSETNDHFSSAGSPILTVSPLKLLPFECARSPIDKLKSGLYDIDMPFKAIKPSSDKCMAESLQAIEDRIDMFFESEGAQNVMLDSYL